jgi:hypothetical protein
LEVTRALEKAIKSWLRAERAGDPNRAELALRLVFTRLPLPAPSPDFARRILARLAGSAWALAVPPRFTLRWKVALGSCFALIALAGGVLPRILIELWAGVGPGKLIELAASLLIGLSSRLAVGIAVWDALVGVARTVSASLASPSMMLVIAASALLCAVALRWLHELLLPERNASYAQPS